MLETLFFGILIGGAIGYTISPKRTDDWYEIHDMMKENRRKYEKDLAYYKKLTRTLVEENAEFRRKINAEQN